jgi:RimJ/RimL family protein N-acetyltransferase
MTVRVRELGPSDAPAFFGLRRQALVEEPFAFLSSLEDDPASSVEAVRAQLASATDGSTVFGALDGETLIGMAGLSRDRPVKVAHRACIWGVYVAASHRRMGIGSRLISAVVDHARSLPGLSVLYLSVSERKPEARQLYESRGFVVWGFEKDFLRYAGESAGEYHLTLAI